MSDLEKLEAIPEQLPPDELFSPFELFTSGETVNIFASEGGRLSPMDKPRNSDLEPVGIGMNGALWEVLRNPGADTESIAKRQEVIEWLIDHPDERLALAGLALDSSRLKSCLDTFVGARFDAVRGNEEDDSSSSRRRHRDTREKIDPEKAKAFYAGSLQASVELADKLSACDNPFLQTCGTHLKAVLERSAADLDPDTIDQQVIANKDNPANPVTRRTTGSVSKQASEVYAYPSFAGHAQKEGFAKVKVVDEADAQALNGLWNFKFSKTKDDWGKEKLAQVKNDTPITKPTVLLTGNNASGKTFHQEARLFAQLSAQAFGYAPAETAVIKPVRNIVVLERARTDAANDLSAFGSEVKTLAKALAVAQEYGEDTLVISDEAFSTTSPEDQATLLRATHQYLRKHGAAILAATHNEGYVDLVEGEEPEALYHLPYQTVTDKFTRETKLVPTFRLEQGKDDAHAIEVARRYGLDESILGRAQEYLDGDIQPTRLPDRRWTRIRELHPETRRQRFRDSAHSRALYPFANYPEVDTTTITTFGYDMQEVRPVIKGFVRDDLHDTAGIRHEVWQRTRQQDIRTREPVYIYSGQSHSPGGEVYPYDREITHFDLGGSRYGGSGYVDELLATGAVAKPEELLERQRLFTELLDPEKRAVVDEALRELHRLYIWPSNSYGNHGWYKHDMVAEPMVSYMENYGIYTLKHPDGLRFLASLARWQDEAHVDTGIEQIAEGLEAIANFQQKQANAQQQLEASTEPTTLEQRQVSFAARVNGLVAFANEHGLGEFKPLALDIYADDEEDIHFEEVFETYRSTNDAIDEYAKALIKRLSDVFQAHPQKFTDIDFDVLSRHVPTILDRIDAFPDRGEKWHQFMDLPNELRQLLFYADKEPRLEQALAALRSIDSIHMHNFANHFEELLGAHLEGQKTGYDCAQLLKERIKTVTGSKERLWEHDEDSYLFTGLHYKYVASQDFARIQSLLELVKAMDREGYKPVGFNDQGEISIEGARNINKSRDGQVANGLHLDPKQQLHILTGANMSGKTFHLKQLLFAQLTAQTTGYAAADQANVPIFSNIIYYDRPGNEEGRDLSAFATEVNQWNRILKSLEGKKRALVIIDEPFSSTSPRYQAALTFALVEKLMAKGHTVVMATHHHQLADNLAGLYPEATDLAHFEIQKDGDEVTFSHKKKEGHAPSDAIAVARSLGGHIMREVLLNV